MKRKNPYDMLKNNSNNNKKNKSLNQSTIKIIKNYLSLEHQKQYPFGKNKYYSKKNKNTYFNLNDIKIKNNINRPHDNLEGGIGNFLNRKYLQSIDNNYFIIKQNKDNLNYEIKRNIISKRVLNPIFNNEPEVGLKNIKGKNIDKERHSTKGNFKSLIDKTPLIIPIKGKKRRNNSYDNKNNILNINNDNNNYMGFEKRGKVKNRRIDIETIECISHLGKRHFSLPKDNVFL